MGKARLKKKFRFDVVLFKGSRTARADAFALPLRASCCACGWPRPVRPDARLECRRPIGLPATFLEVTPATPASHPRVASSRVGPGRRRLASARARWPLGSPNDGAPSGRVATFAAGLLLSRRCVVRLTRGRTRRSPLLRFCFPCNVSQPRCARPENASVRTIPLRRFA